MVVWMLRLKVNKINLFSILPQEFFKPLTSKYKSNYIDCILILYRTYKTELSFGVDKDVIVAALENYFDNESNTEMVFDDEEIVKDSRDKANVVLRVLKSCGWIEEEQSNDYRIKVNLFDYAVTIIESFNKIIKNEEMEYQSLVSQIHATLLNKDSYSKPYEYIIKRVFENTEELMVGLKKLNTNIKKYIDDITNDKTANQIIEEFFVYHKEIGSKAYHRIKTSDNISYFRTSIIDNLYNILNDENILGRALAGYMEVEQVEDKYAAEVNLQEIIINVISAFRRYDDIIGEIDYKHSKYMSSAIARAKFLLTNSNNDEGKISKILSYLSDEFNKVETLNLYDESDDMLINIFNIFPQNFIDSDSLYVVPITKKMSLPQELDSSLGISDEERELRKLALKEKNKRRFSRKNINLYVENILKDKNVVLASSLPIENKRDLIRIIFINLYGKDKKSKYITKSIESAIKINNFKFFDFEIERCDK